MAIDYDLEMATPLPTAQVAAELHQVAQTLGLFDAAVTPEVLVKEGARTVRDTVIRILDAAPGPHDPVTEDLGFRPTVFVGLRQGQAADMSAQDDDMVRLVSGLLDRVPGDVVLHFQYEQVWLLRQNGELSLSEDDDIWPPQRLAAVHQPYRRATHAFN
jgi:hypothetical protein